MAKRLSATAVLDREHRESKNPTRIPRATTTRNFMALHNIPLPYLVIMQVCALLRYTKISVRFLNVSALGCMTNAPNGAGGQLNPEATGESGRYGSNYIAFVL